MKNMTDLMNGQINESANSVVNQFSIDMRKKKPGTTGVMIYNDIKKTVDVYQFKNAIELKDQNTGLDSYELEKYCNSLELTEVYHGGRGEIYVTRIW